MKVWTENEIVELLIGNDLAVERAIARLYSFQTESEKVGDVTKENNGMGFNSADARLGGYYYRWLESGKHLSGRHLSKARTMVLKYRGQLMDYANRHLESVEA